MKDERKGYPSASGIERIMLCPGSWRMEQGLPPEPPSQWSESGTKIHEALTHNHGPDLTADEEETAEKCRDLENETVFKVLGAKADLPLREQRFWLNDPATLDKIMSGKFDALHIVDHHALLLDFKTGRGEVTEPASNKQLRSLAVLVREHFEVSRVTVGIIQPWASPQVSLCEYSEADLLIARAEIIEALQAAQKPDAPLRPGQIQCTYCRARATCPEAWKEIDDLAAVVLRPAPGQVISGKDVGILLERWSLCKQIGGALEAHAKHRLELGEEIPGWHLSKGRTTEEIVDPQRVFQRCYERGVTPEVFMGAVKILKGELKTLLRVATKCKGGKLEVELAKVLEGATESKTSAGSLVREKDP